MKLRLREDPPPDSDMVLVLRPREAAKALGISTRSLWSWTKSGDIPHFRQGRTVLYPVDALREWLERKTKQG